ncbi:hypothetical protein Vafri_6317 [Volvox africanus]|uniref:Uncharacterized protein n=1 Tax=Volvox africanus TaxID=51714 RepID=A0A8J4AY21_9CHLO|nr:hypothetical protein Vafri_6317 [Volvox africanus]
MDYAEDAAVPEDAAENFAAQMGLLTRSASRKRLFPESLEASDNYSVPRGGAPAWEPADIPMVTAMLLGYRSCPGGDHHQDSVRMRPRLRVNKGTRGSNGVGVETSAFEPTADNDIRKDSAGVRVLSERLAQESAALSHEVPVVASLQVGSTTATTAASTLAISTTSTGHVPSAPPLPPPVRAALYSKLLSGPGFSYVVDGDECLGSDTLSLGSLGSGSYMLGGDDDYENDFYDNDDSGAESELFTPCDSRSAGSVYSGSGKSSGGAAVTAALPAVAARLSPPPTCSFRRPTIAVAPTVALDGSLGAAAHGTAVTTTTVAATSEPKIAAIAAMPNNGPLGRSRGVHVVAFRADRSGDDDGSAGLRPEASAHEEDSGSDSPVRSNSIHESVGSSNFEVPSSSYLVRAAVRDGGIAAEYVVAADAAGDAVGGAWLPGGTPETGMQWWRTIGREGARGGGGSGGGSDGGGGATVTVPTLQHVAAPPALLPPEVYLGFINQLVESVRTAARAVENACHADR